MLEWRLAELPSPSEIRHDRRRHARTPLPPATHVPAGGVTPGEPLEEAVLRDVAEECGLACVQVLRLVAEEHTPHWIRRFPCRTTFFELAVDSGTTA
ncbi:NUDIX domain-containing protein [Streptomyces sp. NPDC094149]|uniref:NUDIX domain-containing protein n=1 Tax=Streptomyces sp. NPDC094149 TaxID=3155079 RepID=UPI00332B9330